MKESVEKKKKTGIKSCTLLDLDNQELAQSSYMYFVNFQAPYQSLNYIQILRNCKMLTLSNKILIREVMID